MVIIGLNENWMVVKPYEVLGTGTNGVSPSIRERKVRNG